jgi:outer membrane biogenesis lipoprotein LolB
LITLLAGAFLLLNAVIYYAVLPARVSDTSSAERQQQRQQQAHANLQQAAAAADSSDILYDRNTVHTQPGGADAELLCLDRRRDCAAR